jgi:hypothetical protein
LEVFAKKISIGAKFPNLGRTGRLGRSIKNTEHFKKYKNAQYLPKIAARKNLL